MKLVAAAALLGLAFGAQAQDAKIAMEEFMIPSGDPGISLYVRNKHPEGMSRVRSTTWLANCRAQGLKNGPRSITSCVSFLLQMFRKASEPLICLLLRSKTFD